jgi:hypothetical protein
MNGSKLAVRIAADNPNHHLWCNNGTWWLYYTRHDAGYTKCRVRESLRTGNVEVARQLRDRRLRELQAETPFMQVRESASFRYALAA